MKGFFSIIIFFFTGYIIHAQDAELGTHYKDFVFEKIRIQKDLLYKGNLPAGSRSKYDRFDLYEPAADSSRLRPLIIWLHGGGFKFGKKKSGGLPLWSKTFARRGYVCAAINYQLSEKHPLKNFEDLVEGCAAAIEDLNEAIKYFKQHASVYRIDTQQIIVGGNSAGGMIALQAVYSSPALMAKMMHRGDSTSAAAQLYNPQHIAAVINYWGALFNTNWLKNAKVPIVSVHGKKDRVVPYDSSKQGLYGGLAIHRAADAIRLPNALKVYDGYAHELQRHFNPLFAGRGAKKRWLEAGQFAANFLYDQLFGVK
ncbi:MAG: alpha/beta hydrolase [Chitinophagaceae bacterium]